MADYPMFNSYKGLQKPLVFKMFKGRFIYVALGVLVGAMLMAMIVSIIWSLVVGLITFLVGGLGGLAVALMNQKKNGLYRKNKNQGVFIISHTRLSKFER